MKTDDLIDMLSTNVEPVDHRQIVRNIGMAVAAGAAVALAIVFFVLGPRAGLSSYATLASALLRSPSRSLFSFRRRSISSDWPGPAENAERRQYSLRRHLSPSLCWQR